MREFLECWFAWFIVLGLPTIAVGCDDMGIRALPMGVIVAAAGSAILGGVSCVMD